MAEICRLPKPTPWESQGGFNGWKHIAITGICLINAWLTRTHELIIHPEFSGHICSACGFCALKPQVSGVGKFWISAAASSSTACHFMFFNNCVPTTQNPGIEKHENGWDQSQITVFFGCTHNSICHFIAKKRDHLWFLKPGRSKTCPWCFATSPPTIQPDSKNQSLPKIFRKSIFKIKKNA